MGIIAQPGSALICILAALGPAGCASARHATHVPSSATVFNHKDGMLGCEEVGLVAETDGCLRLVPACCASVEHSPPSQARAIALAARAASKLGDAVLILYVAQQDHLKTDCEGCCSVRAYRAYGVAFLCSEDKLQWHLKHEESLRRLLVGRLTRALS